MTPIEWLLGNDTGISSKTILAVMTDSVNTNSFGGYVPHDPSDFGRCYRLLELFPEWKSRMWEVAEAYPKWEPLIDVWDELTALYEQEHESGKCPKLYKRMRELV